MSAIQSYLINYVIENPRTKRRNILTETVFAENFPQARRRIAEKGGHVVSFHEQRTAKLTGAFSGRLRQQISILRQLVNFITLRQSPSAAMQALVNSQRTARRLAMTPASETLSRGGTLAEAMQVLNLYKEPIIRLIEAGEKTNTAREAINHAITLLESQRKLANQLYAALGWIAVDILATVSSIAYLHLRFLPDVAAQGIQTPNAALRDEFATAVGTATIINATLFYGQFAIAFGGYFLYMLYSTREKYGGLLIDRIERLPGLRSYLLDSSLAQSFGALSRILKAGMHLPQALMIAAQSASCVAVRRMMTTARARVEHGDTIGSALDPTILSATEQNELEGQTSTDTLAEACGRIAEAREEATKASNRRLVTYTVVLSIAYGSASVLSFLWVLLIQNKAQMESLNNLGFQ